MFLPPAAAASGPLRRLEERDEFATFDGDQGVRGESDRRITSSRPAAPSYQGREVLDLNAQLHDAVRTIEPLGGDVKDASNGHRSRTTRPIARPGATLIVSTSRPTGENEGTSALSPAAWPNRRRRRSLARPLRPRGQVRSINLQRFDSAKLLATAVTRGLDGRCDCAWRQRNSRRMIASSSPRAGSPSVATRAPSRRPRGASREGRAHRTATGT